MNETDWERTPPLDAIWETPFWSPLSPKVEKWAATPERATELRAMPYQDYLQTPEWRYRRDEMVKAAEHRCGRCRRRSSRLQVHHRTYERLGNEQPEDLEVLCRRCHQQEHGLMPR